MATASSKPLSNIVTPTVTQSSHDDSVIELQNTRSDQSSDVPQKVVTIGELLRSNPVPKNTTNPDDEAENSSRSNDESDDFHGQDDDDLDSHGGSFDEDDRSISTVEVLENESQDDEQFQLIWNYEKTFNNEEEMKVFLKGENTWSLRSTQDLSNGKKFTYRCNKVKLSGPQCNAGIYIQSVLNIDHENEDAEIEVHYRLYRKSQPHNHEALQNKSSKVTPKVKNIIIDCFKNNKKPTAICYQIRGDKTIQKNEQPTMTQIKNIIASYKRNQYGKDPITMKKLTEFVEQHLHIPNEDDDAFIAAFERSPPDQKENKFFRFFITTKRLLKNATNCKNIHADATYKVTIEKLPLIVVGTTDINKTFHLIGFIISSHQTANAYEFAFRATQNIMTEVTGNAFKPEVLICDADPAIHKGWYKVFAHDTKIIMCFFHVMHNVNKYAYTSKENKEKIKTDMQVLHLCYDEDLFDFACELFIDKWKSKEKKVIKSIEKSFMNKNKNWFIGAHFKAPKTNNALERFNGTLKLFQTDHAKKPLKQFMQLAMKMIQQRSREYIMDKAEFQTELHIPKDVFSKGIELKANYIASEENENGEVEFYMFASSISRELTQKDIDDFKSTEYDSFDNFMKKAFTIWKMVFPKDLINWQMATCTCPAYDNHFICKHITSIAHKLGLIEEQAENYDNEPLFVNPKGRPKRASKALMKD